MILPLRLVISFCFITSWLPENIKKAWANSDVILKQSYRELPKLISVCERCAKFEKGWVRKKKIALIESTNSGWDDLSCNWFAERDSSSPKETGSSE
ncbi:MAG: hypothetical protein COW89_09520 [Nitrospinae bacterium CG22_combo_CG10-13_8_21_14_all_47_10]|nr:MAG: hypothetical protein COW89_09520 [Nitrospinae bacterium CG22_combo_CG10-13_8_21_14_all_47_10]